MNAMFCNFDSYLYPLLWVITCNINTGLLLIGLQPCTLPFLGLFHEAFLHASICQVDSSSAEKKSEAEPSFEILTNPARVVPPQEKFIKFLEDSRYVPVKTAASGFVLLKDLHPNEPEELSLTDTPSLAAGGSAAGQQGSALAMAVDEEEPAPPQPFEYNT